MYYNEYLSKLFGQIMLWMMLVIIAWITVKSLWAAIARTFNFVKSIL